VLLLACATLKVPVSARQMANVCDMESVSSRVFSQNLCVQETAFRKVVQATMIRDRQHGPVIEVNRIQVTSLSSSFFLGLKAAGKHALSDINMYTGWHRINRAIYFCCPSTYFYNKTRKYDNVRVAPKTLAIAVLNVSSTGCNNERQSFENCSIVQSITS